MTELTHNAVKGLTVTVAVSDLPAAVALYREALQLPEPRYSTSEADQVEVALFSLGDSQLHLVAATSDESLIARDIAQKGEGLHHFGLVVESVGAALSYLADHGLRTIGSSARDGAFGNRVGFVHPRSMGGVLVELIEPRTEE